MKFYFIFSLFLLFAPKAMAQDSIKLPILFSVGSGDTRFDLQYSDRKQRKENVPQSVLYPDKKMARITRVSDNQLRFEFETPLRLTLYSSIDHSYVADRTLNGFLADTSVEYADRVMSLATGEYLILDDIVKEHITDFVRTSESEGYDKFIKQYVNHRSPPRLLHFTALSFYLPLSQVGTVGGVPMNFSVTSRPQLLPWTNFNPAGTNEPRDDLMRLKAVYSASDPFIIEFQKQIKNLIQRMNQLMLRGWLDGLKSKSYFEADPQEALKVPSETVISLESRLRCRIIFNP